MDKTVIKKGGCAINNERFEALVRKLRDELRWKDELYNKIKKEDDYYGKRRSNEWSDKSILCNHKFETDRAEILYDSFVGGNNNPFTMLK